MVLIKLEGTRDIHVIPHCPDTSWLHRLPYSYARNAF